MLDRDRGLPPGPKGRSLSSSRNSFVSDSIQKEGVIFATRGVDDARALEYTAL